MSPSAQPSQPRSTGVSKDSRFTYVNPFDHLHATVPIQRHYHGTDRQGATGTTMSPDHGESSSREVPRHLPTPGKQQVNSRPLKDSMSTGGRFSIASNGNASATPSAHKMKLRSSNPQSNVHKSMEKIHAEMGTSGSEDSKAGNQSLLPSLSSFQPINAGQVQITYSAGPVLNNQASNPTAPPAHPNVSPMQMQKDRRREAKKRRKTAKKAEKAENRKAEEVSSVSAQTATQDRVPVSGVKYDPSGQLFVKTPPWRAGKRDPVSPALIRPQPSPAYLQHVSVAPSLVAPRQLLVILDLNGTLGHRSSLHNLRARPHLTDFLDYLFAHHTVMIWTSMKLGTVRNILPRIFTQDQLARLLSVWTREDLRLDVKSYAGHVQTYKRLEWVWQAYPGRGPADTVLVDDNGEKARGEPWNHVVVKAWEGPTKGTGMDDSELLRVVEVLEKVRKFDDVARGLRWLSMTEVEGGVGREGGVRVDGLVGEKEGTQSDRGRDGVVRDTTDVEMDELTRRMSDVKLDDDRGAETGGVGLDNHQGGTV